MYKKFKQALSQVLESSKKRLDFKNINYLPRWVILGFDSLIDSFFTYNYKINYKQN